MKEVAALKYKRANITIPLVIILFLSFGVLYLSKYIVDSQESVSTAIDSRYQGPSITLSTLIDQPQDWETYENTSYFYRVKYPRQWPASRSKPQTGDLSTYERFLSKKINLKVRVLSSYKHPSNAKLSAVDNKDFYISRGQDSRIASLSHAKYFYVLELTQDNYFADPKEFDGTFLQVLKNFELTKQ